MKRLNYDVLSPLINGQILILSSEGSRKCFEIQSITPDADGNLTFATTTWTAVMPARSMRITSGGAQHYLLYIEQVEPLQSPDEDSLMFISAVTGDVIVLYKEGHPNNFIPPN